MIAQALRGPHNIYRRYQGLLEASLTATFFALVVVFTLNSLAVYPFNWVLVLGLAIAILGGRWPLIAYVLAVTALVYPIYTINLYLAVLFLAISALGHRLFTHYLGATTLVLATPVLTQYHLHWLVPVLAGLWWGAMIGAWVGGSAAIWGKIIGGMSGLNIDWLVLAGQTPDIQAVIARFQDANSLETLLLLVEPFAATSSIILYNLLQVIGWALAGAFVGTLAGHKWVKYHTPWSVLVVTAGGGLIMLGTHLGLPYWLNDAVTETNILVPQDSTAPLFSLIMVIIVGTLVYTIRESFDLPVAPKRSLRMMRRQQKSRKINNPFNFLKRSAKSKPELSPKQGIQQSEIQPEQRVTTNSYRRPVKAPHHSELPEWEPPKDDNDLIMLEID